MTLSGIVDRIVETVSPERALQRQAARRTLALYGAYHAADLTRRQNQNHRRIETDADSAILFDLPVLRQTSQDLIRNNPLACGAVKTNVTKIVGTGLKVKPTIDRDVLGIEEDAACAWERAAWREYQLATETREIDAERKFPFSILQGIAFLKSLEDGDSFVNMPRFRRAGSPYLLKLQLIEAARISNPDWRADTPGLVAGIEKDQYGAPAAYHVCNVHPGNRRTRQGDRKIAWTRIPAFAKNGDPMCLQLYDPNRPNQSRGVPYLAPIMEAVKQLGRYTDAEIHAAVISALVAITMKKEDGDPSFGPASSPANPTGSAASQYDPTAIELRSGSVLGLQPGEEIGVPTPGRPNPAFGDFWTSFVRQLGVALELPFEVLIKHFTASYSASRAALMEAWDYFRRRRHWLVVTLCQPVYEAVIAEAVATGRLEAPGFFSDPLKRRAWLGATWIGDAPYHLDPLKEVSAAQVRMEQALTTHAEECAAMPQGGSDWEAKIPQIIRERAILMEADIISEPPEPGEPESVEPMEPVHQAEESDTETGDTEGTDHETD